MLLVARPGRPRCLGLGGTVGFEDGTVGAVTARWRAAGAMWRRLLMRPAPSSSTGGYGETGDVGADAEAFDIRAHRWRPVDLAHSAQTQYYVQNGALGGRWY